MAKFYFRYGAMDCGKTTALLQVAHNYEEKGMRVIIVKPSIDTKGGKCIVSRLGIKRKVDVWLRPKDHVRNLIDLKNTDCILVDEAQFLKPDQVQDFWLIAKLYNIPVICYGLRTTFQTKLFEGSKPIMELADELEELITICKCGSRAKFQARKVNGNYVTEGGEVAIDGENSDTYESLCGKCYIEEVLGIHEL